MLIIIAQYTFSIMAALGAFLFFRRMPVEWLLDYGDTKASAELYRKQQIPFTPYAIILSISSMLIVFILRRQDNSFIISLAYLFICLVLFLIVIADYRTRIIPDQFIIALLPLAILLWFFDEKTASGLLIRAASAVGGGAFLFLVSWLGSRLMKQEAMGMGDVKLLAVAGLLTGFPGIVMVFFLAFLIAALPAIILLIIRRLKPDTDGSLAFGPYISLAVIVVILFEHKLAELWSWWLDTAAIML